MTKPGNMEYRIKRSDLTGGGHDKHNIMITIGNRPMTGKGAETGAKTNKRKKHLEKT